MKKTVRELTKFARLHHSLGGKTFRAILLLAAIVGICAIAFGFILYSSAVTREYRTKTYNLASTASMILNLKTIKEKSEEVLDIYDSIPEEERKDAEGAEYLAQFNSVQDMTHNKLRWDVHELQLANDAVAGYVAALDLENNRMVFIADGDQASTYCPPGYYDYFDDKQINIWMEGNKLNLLDKLNGAKPLTAVVLKMERYGYRCTAGKRLFNLNGYPVFIFYDTDMSLAAKAGQNFFWQYFVVLFVVAFITGFFIMHFLRKNVVSPINELTDAAEAYTEDTRSEHRDGHYFDKLNIKTGDEIENLALTMKDMERDIEGYVKNLTRVTAEKERISTELDVASKIQEGMIPNIYPAFPERNEFDLYATMDPAKEVGGDFYDYFLLDDDHLAMVMADVSGKGIPAALFMMASKIMLNNISVANKTSPAQILERVNNGICANNTAEMFVTVWLGIVELSTGKVIAANAGHEYPAIKRADGSFELYKDPHGIVIGAMSGMKYKEYEFQLSPGDSLFQYTDGVTEATNSSGELFGTDRMLEALNVDQAANPEMLLIHVREAIDDFVAEAPQFDDITMLAFKYLGPKEDA